MLKHGAYGLIGKKHNVTQDSYCIVCEKDFGVFAVSDGMGGYAAGDVASGIVTDIIKSKVTQYDKKQLKAAIDEANIKILSEAGKSPDYEGMGATLALCCIKGENAVIAHIGDSKVFVIEDGRVVFKTRDHSLVQKMVDDGEITEVEASVHSMKNVITRAVGVQKSVEAEMTELKLKNNSKILICSDGVSNFASENDICDIVTDNDAGKAAECLCKLASDAGSMDDITAIVISYENQHTEELK